MDSVGFEPTASCLQSRRAATAPRAQAWFSAMALFLRLVLKEGRVHDCLLNSLFFKTLILYVELLKGKIVFPPKSTEISSRIKVWR